jgi:hypothetical protein
MRRLSLALAAVALCSMPLTACASIPDAAAAVAGLPATPASFCDNTGMDESAGLAMEGAYKLFRTGTELAVDLGRIKGPTATKFAKIDNEFFAATQTVQQAYLACNAPSYKLAIDHAKAVLADAQAALAAAK